ncbi:uncharacterized protein [Spinacia oleracea]|uniref:ABC1 atypical kinase-like domain-containing protein n=1 Tax=Spinacia oleracea TaxID=3562 RepID=A0ABM3RG77_SPIOL|nr:uncharacterized protein LOC110792590 [Spinacia oleracea]XP_056694617.1 uncharacterized protein LOC110792590 [Spinacia oleracea]
MGELDYGLEAANASRFLEAHSSFPFIRVPKVFPQLTRKKVLTMEWVAGENPNDFVMDLNMIVLHTPRNRQLKRSNTLIWNTLGTMKNNQNVVGHESEGGSDRVITPTTGDESQGIYSEECALC